MRPRRCATKVLAIVRQKEALADRRQGFFLLPDGGYGGRQESWSRDRLVHRPAGHAASMAITDLFASRAAEYLWIACGEAVPRACGCPFRRAPRAATASRPSVASTVATMPAGVEAGLLVHLLRLVVVDEDVGQHHRPHLQAAVEQARAGQVLQHVAAEAADRAFLDGDQHLVLARQPADQVVVERLGEAGIGDRRRQAEARRAPRPPSGTRQAACRSDSSATVVPSRTMRPLPISSGMPSAGSSTPTPSPRG